MGSVKKGVSERGKGSEKLRQAVLIPNTEKTSQNADGIIER